MSRFTRFLIGAVIVAGVAFALGQAQARNNLKFDAFQANLADILSGVATYCRRHPGQMAFAASGADYRDDLFREACGKGLFRQKLPFGDWGVFYCEADYPDGNKSILALANSSPMAGGNIFW